MVQGAVFPLREMLCSSQTKGRDESRPFVFPLLLLAGVARCRKPLSCAGYAIAGWGRGMADKKPIASVTQIESRILLIRGQKVMLDADLAELYGVETGALNRAVKRNSERFPEDFMFQLTAQEFENLRCQIGTSNMRSQNGISKRGGVATCPTPSPNTVR